MSMNLVTLLYLIASVCFIQALKGLSHPTTSIRGNLFGMVGMAIAAVTTAALIVKLANGNVLGLSWVLLGLVVGTEQIADHFGDRHKVARIDLGFIFLRTARPHGALDAWLAGQRIERFTQSLVRRELPHADALGLVGGNAERHPLLFEAKHIEFELHAGDFLPLQFNHTANAVLWVYDIIADVEGQRLGSHSVEPFRGPSPLRMRGDSRAACARKGDVDFCVSRRTARFSASVLTYVAQS